MRTPSPPRGLLCVCLLVLAAGVATPAAADEPFDLTVDDAVETPSETIEIDGSEYDVDEVAVIEPGDPLEMQVASAENYYVILYDTDRNAQHREYAAAEQPTVTMGTADDALDTTHLAPGTYVLSLEPDGQGREAVTPVVVQGYDVDLEYPTEVAHDDAFDLEATVESTSDMAPPETVDVAIGDEEGGTDVTLEHRGGANYRATVSAAAFGSGTHDVYGAVTGDETAEGYPVAYAATDGPALTVTADAENDSGADDENDSEAGDEDSESDGDPDDDASETTDADEDVIDPNASDDDETDDDGVGVGATAALVALAVVGLLGARRAGGRSG